MTERKIIDKLVHTPTEIAAAYVTWYRERQKHPGITWGIPVLDKHCLPMRPGELTTILGRPGMGKSSLLAALALQEAKRIAEQGQAEHEAVVFVTWENSVEELANLLLSGPRHSTTDTVRGLVPIKQVEKECVSFLRKPIFIIGRGVGGLDAHKIRMTPDVVFEAIETMWEYWKIKPTLLLFDFLQLIPSKTHKDRLEQVTEAPIRIKELALTVGAPAVAAVQAARRVDTYKVKIPKPGDSQWSSAIEQISDRMLGLWRPILTEDVETITIGNGKVIPITENLLLVRKLKERFNIGSANMMLYFDPALLRLCEMEISNLNEMAGLT